MSAWAPARKSHPPPVYQMSVEAPPTCPPAPGPGRRAGETARRARLHVGPSLLPTPLDQGHGDFWAQRSPARRTPPTTTQTETCGMEELRVLTSPFPHQAAPTHLWSPLYLVVPPLTCLDPVECGQSFLEQRRELLRKLLPILLPDLVFEAMENLEVGRGWRGVERGKGTPAAR